MKSVARLTRCPRPRLVPTSRGRGQSKVSFAYAAGRAPKHWNVPRVFHGLVKIVYSNVIGITQSVRDFPRELLYDNTCGIQPKLQFLEDIVFQLNKRDEAYVLVSRSNVKILFPALQKMSLLLTTWKSPWMAWLFPSHRSRRLARIVFAGYPVR